MNRMAAMVIMFMVLLNIGGAIDLIFSAGKQDWAEFFKMLSSALVLNGVGVWLLRGLRDD